MRQSLRRLTDDLLHLIAPNLCPACDELLLGDERGYCRACRASLAPAPFPREILSAIAGHYDRDELAFDAIGALYAYDPDSPTRRLIHALKYEGCRAIGVELGRELGRALTMFTEFEGVEMVIPVPLHRARRRERGYNQSDAIAEGIALALPGSTVLHGLDRRRHTASQTTFDAAGRRENVRAAFTYRGASLRGRSVLVCDDVCTTGSTLNTCAEALLAAGAVRVAAAAVAHNLTERARPDISSLFPGAH